MQHSVVLKSALDNIVLRIDAEYYHPAYIALEKQLKKLPSISMLTAKAQLDCSAFYPSIVPYYNFGKIGIPFLRVNEIQNGLLHLTKDTAFLPIEILDENKSTIAKCQTGDLIIAKGGNSLAKVALLTEEYPLYSICRDVIVLRTAHLNKINRFFLWVFLHSDTGQKVLLRTASQTGQPHLTIEAIYNIEIPIFSHFFQDRFEGLYKKSQELKSLSYSIFQETQVLLLSELGLLDWKPKHRLSFVKNYSDTQQAERFDAEYFQPKYDKIVAAIKSYKVGYDSVEKLLTLNDKNFTPDPKTQYDYIELANIGGNGEITGCTTEYGNELPSRARRKVAANDVVVSSIEGSLSSIALITDDFNGALCSTGFHVVKSKQFNAETLLVLLKSIAGQLQLKKGCSGTILTAINKDEFQRVVLPVIRDEIQEQIQQKITEAFNLRKQSMRLLECAKKAVEMAIEEDEKTAMKWLKTETGSIG